MDKPILLKYEKLGIKTTLFLEGKDLVKIADMSFYSADYFFKMLPTFLRFNGFFNCELFSKEVIADEEINSLTVGKLLVPFEEYETIKKALFDFAYISCSNKGIKDSKLMNIYNEKKILMCALYTCKKLKEEDQIFHTLYKDFNGDYKIIVSNQKFNQEMIDKRFAILKR